MASYCNSLSLYFGWRSVIPRDWEKDLETENSGPWKRLKPSPVTTQQSGEVLRRDGRDGILPGFDGGIHCPRWLDGWLRMWDGWLQMVVARLCPLMASMAISRLIGYQRRPDSNHCQSRVLSLQCITLHICSGSFPSSLFDKHEFYCWPRGHRLWQRRVLTIATYWIYIHAKLLDVDRFPNNWLQYWVETNACGGWLEVIRWVADIDGMADGWR